LVIAPCAADDLDDVVELVNLSYRGASSQAGWTHEHDWIAGPRTTRAGLEQELSASGDAVIFGLRDADGVLQACVLLDMSRGGAERTAYIGMLTVRPDLQDAGLGRRMLAHAEDEARRRGARRARMTVLSIRDSLIAWYERRSYARSGETQPFPYDDQRFGTPRRTDLEFTVLEKALGD
jgi:ribosomal protein S18 acetylase RimI-like enzyme